MDEAFGTYEFDVRTYECGPDGRASLPTICNYLQEAASRNAESLKFSKTNFDAAGENISWVLTRLRVKMDRYPRWEDRATVATWPSGGRRIVAYRDFEIRDAAGAHLGSATSEWMLIDLSSRRVVPIPGYVFSCVNTARGRILGETPFAKLRWEGPAEANAGTFRAKRGDIDMNGHVNNVHYVEWLLEGVPADAGVCRDFDIVFKAETLAGEDVNAACVEQAPGTRLHRLFAADGRDHVLAKTEFERRLPFGRQAGGEVES